MRCARPKPLRRRRITGTTAPHPSPQPWTSPLGGKRPSRRGMRSKTSLYREDLMSLGTEPGALGSSAKSSAAARREEMERLPSALIRKPPRQGDILRSGMPTRPQARHLPPLSARRRIGRHPAEGVGSMLRYISTRRKIRFECSLCHAATIGVRGLADPKRRTCPRLRVGSRIRSARASMHSP